MLAICEDLARYMPTTHHLVDRVQQHHDAKPMFVCKACPEYHESHIGTYLATKDEPSSE